MARDKERERDRDRERDGAMMAITVLYYTVLKV